MTNRADDFFTGEVSFCDVDGSTYWFYIVVQYGGKFLFVMLMVSIWGYNCMIPSGKVKDNGSIMESAESCGTIYDPL